MKGSKSTPTSVAIARGYWDVPVRVRLGPYVQFSRRLDRQLEELVSQWIHTAAPNASRPRRRGR